GLSRCAGQRNCMSAWHAASPIQRQRVLWGDAPCRPSTRTVVRWNAPRKQCRRCSVPLCSHRGCESLRRRDRRDACGNDPHGWPALAASAVHQYVEANGLIPVVAGRTHPIMAGFPVLSWPLAWPSGQLYLGCTPAAPAPLCSGEYWQSHPWWHGENPAHHVGSTLVPAAGLARCRAEPWLWGTTVNTLAGSVVGQWSSDRLAGSRR